MKRFRLIVLLWIVLVFFLSSVVQAQLYEYTDEKGNLCLTDNIDLLSQKDRSKVRLIELNDNNYIQKKNLSKLKKTKNQRPSLGFIKIDPQTKNILNHKQVLISILRKEGITIAVILILFFLGGYIFSYIMKKIFKSRFPRVIVKITALLLIILGLYCFYFSYIGRQLSDYIPKNKKKILYTPSDIIKQIKMITKQVEEAGERKIKQLNNLEN